MGNSAPHIGQTDRRRPDRRDQLRIALHDNAPAPCRWAACSSRSASSAGGAAHGRTRRTQWPALRGISASALADPDAIARAALAFHASPAAAQYDAARHRLIVAIADAHDIVALDLRARLRPGAAWTAPRRRQRTRPRDRAALRPGQARSGHGARTRTPRRSAHRRSDARTAARGAPGRRPARRGPPRCLRPAPGPELGFLRVRHRIDGTLRQVRAMHKSCWPELAVRIKVLAGMDIADRAAQGRAHRPCGRRPADRLPRRHQPTLAARTSCCILDRDKGHRPARRSVDSPDQRCRLDPSSPAPRGLILVVGPTGSGKTTTLYSDARPSQHRGRSTS